MQAPPLVIQVVTADDAAAAEDVAGVAIIEIRYYFITDNINRGAAAVKHCPTEDMIADFFTKPLQGSQFRKLRNLILNHYPSADRSSDGQECVGSRPDNRQTSLTTTVQEKLHLCN